MSSERPGRSAAWPVPAAANADAPDRVDGAGPQDAPAAAAAAAIVPDAGQGYEIVGFWHLDFPEPRFGELLIALAGLPRPANMFCAVGVAASASAAFLPLGVSLIGAAAGAAAWLLWRAATSGLVGRWRRDRGRRRLLNTSAARDERRLRLGEWAERSADEARRTWDAYVADAIVGRVQSMLHDRPPPRLGAIEALMAIDAEAERHGIAFARAHTARPLATLPVPPAAAFEPDIVSPTLMNLSAASLARARGEGPRRAARRHCEVTERAAAFGPTYQDACNAAVILRHADLMKQTASRSAPPS